MLIVPYQSYAFVNLNDYLSSNLQLILRVLATQENPGKSRDPTKKSRDFKNAVNWVGSRDPGKDLRQIEVGLLHDHFEPLYYSIVPKSY